MPRFLVTGAAGQIGSELVRSLRRIHGDDDVVASDIREAANGRVGTSGPFVALDVLEADKLAAICARHKIDRIVHLAAILSATGERHPALCWNVNMNGLRNVLEVAREQEMEQVYCPSSIAVFGPETPRVNTPQEAYLKPRTMYGLTKVSGELLCEYYARRYGLDVRGVRYPGIISSETAPGGGTTDYAVEIFREAVKTGRYNCFLGPDTRLPMMYMPDCLKATVDIIQADRASLTRFADYNIAGFSFTPAELAASIRKHMPAFEIAYEPDYRQAIADSWPESIDDSRARTDWNWQPSYDLDSMTSDMLAKLRARREGGAL